jgi:hypothetical protein
VTIKDNEPAPAQDTASVLFGMDGVEVTEAEREADGRLTVWGRITLPGSVTTSVPPSIVIGTVSTGAACRTPGTALSARTAAGPMASWPGAATTTSAPVVCHDTVVSNRVMS